MVKYYDMVYRGYLIKCPTANSDWDADYLVLRDDKQVYKHPDCSGCKEWVDKQHTDKETRHAG